MRFHGSSMSSGTAAAGDENRTRCTRSGAASCTPCTLFGCVMDGAMPLEAMGAGAQRAIDVGRTGDERLQGVSRKGSAGPGGRMALDRGLSLWSAGGRGGEDGGRVRLRRGV